MSLIERYAANLQGRDLAIGDIHGHYSRLEACLAAIDFDPKRDRLFSVGDLVDRGPESERALDWLALPWFHAVRGNHEDVAIRCARGNPIDRDAYSRNGGDWFMALPASGQQRFASAFAKLPIAIEVRTGPGVVGLLHADCPLSDWRLLAHALDEAGPSARLTEACMWSRRRIESQDCSGVDGIRAVIVGHTPMPALQTLGNVYHIDTAGWQSSGYFTLLNLASLEAEMPAMPNLPPP